MGKVKHLVASPGAKMAILMTLSVLLVGVASFGVYYTKTKRVPNLPGISAVLRNQEPRFLFNIFGVAEPFGVATSPDGSRVYVAEQSGERQIRVFDRGGNQLFTISRPDSTWATRLPVFMAVHPDGRLFVTDRARNEVQVFSPTGEFQTAITAPDKIWAPVGLAIDASGRLYVGDIEIDRQRVLVFNANLEFESSFGKMGPEPGEMDYPSGIAVGSDGRLYVGQSLSMRVDIFDTNGTYIGKDLGNIGAGLPRGLAVDSQSRLYLVDNINGLVAVFDMSKKPATSLFSFGQSTTSGDRGLNYPNAVAIDGTGRIYVTDRMNNRVQVWGY